MCPIDLWMLISFPCTFIVPTSNKYFVQAMAIISLLNSFTTWTQFSFWAWVRRQLACAIKTACSSTSHDLLIWSPRASASTSAWSNKRESHSLSLVSIFCSFFDARSNRYLYCIMTAVFYNTGKVDWQVVVLNEGHESNWCNSIGCW